MGEQELVFDVLEMSVVSVTCSECFSGITFNVCNGDTGLPTECPVCHKDFRQVGKLLGDYRQFYRAVQGIKPVFQFRVRVKK